MTARPNQTSKKATVSKTATKTAATQRVDTSATSPAPKKTAAASAASAATERTVRRPRPSRRRPSATSRSSAAGPGDPELLTVRAVELLREAEVVVTEVPSHAELVRTVLGLPTPRVVVDEDGNEVRGAGRRPEFVDGGFGQDGQPLTHAARAKVVVKQAKSGRRVVRLMAGDPFVYASGPEEAQACVKAGHRLRDRARRLLGHRGPGVRRHPADHQEQPRGRGGHLRRGQGRLVRSTPTTAPWCCCPRSSSIGEIAKALVAAGRSAGDARCR